MGELIKVNFDHEKMDGISLSARDLHEKLGIKKWFTQWWSYQVDNLGFVEDQDFLTILLESTGGRPGNDYIVSLDTAKHLCMVSGGEKAHEIRQYFIEIEKQWNSPEAVKRRAYKLICKENLEFKEKITNLRLTLLEQKPKVDYCDYVLQAENLVNTTVIAKDYGYKSAEEFNKLLHEEGIQYKSGGVWVLYSKYSEEGYTQTKTEKIKNRYGIFTGEVYLHSQWTQKGRMFIYQIIKERGLVPVMERTAFQEIEQSTVDNKLLEERRANEKL